MEDKQRTGRSDQYEAVIAAMNEGVMVFDGGGRIVFGNRRAEELMGFEGALEKQSIQRLLLDREGRYDGFVDTVSDAIYNNETRANRTIPFSLNGEERHYYVTTSYLDRKKFSGEILAVINDVTEAEKLHAAFGRYVSDDVAKAILDKPGGLSMGGVSREVTILMSDLRGFTATSGQMDAQDLTDMLTHYFEAMHACIDRFNGTVIEFLGDGILAVFGAPVESERHAADAVSAAMAMQKSMDAINAWNEERSFPHLAMGIGIHTGEAVVGNIGCEARTKYGVLGNSVNIAGRTESYTADAQVLITAECARRIKEELSVVQETDVTPKGMEEPLHLLEVNGIGGEGGIFYERKRKPLRALSHPYPVTCAKLMGKQVSNELWTGQIRAVSDERISLKTKAKLEVFDNIHIDLAGGCYGKIEQINNDELLVSLTYTPKGYALWLKAMEECSNGEG